MAHDRPTQPAPSALRLRPPTSRRSAALTDVGRKRKSNEDAYFVDDELGLWVVCDGMGGHAAGEVASQEAVETVFGMIKRGVPALAPIGTPPGEDAVRAARRLMESAIQAATYMVFSMAELDSGKRGMGTTISAMLDVGGGYAVVGQVGDSRVYRLRGGVVDQLTEDHTLIAWQIKQGLITEEEAARSPHRNVITRAVGNKEYVEVDTLLVELAAGDRFLLCSDGLHGYLAPGDIEPVLELDGEDAVQRFVALANDRGGKDNVTAVVIEFL